MKRPLVLHFIFVPRYDEWIKADKIVRPANKNVPKVKHRKKIKVRRHSGNVSACSRLVVSCRDSLTVLNVDRTKLRRSKTSWRDWVREKPWNHRPTPAESHAPSVA